MKRALVVALLLMMIATSLSAGTLAIYTKTVDLGVQTVTAKRFALGVNQGGQSEFDLKIAPGEMVSYYFEVSNVNGEGAAAEVALDVMIQSNFSAVYDAFPGIRAQLLLHTGSGYDLVGEADSGGMLTWNRRALFEAGSGQTRRFILSFQWAQGDAAKALVLQNRIVKPLTLYVRGTQHIAGGGAP